MSPPAGGLIAENGVAVDGVGAEWISRDDKSHVIKYDINTIADLPEEIKLFFGGKI